MPMQLKAMLTDGGWDGGRGWEIEADSEIYHELL